jgi:hypothetical protein
LDANLIRVAHKCRDIGRLACLMALLAKRRTFRSDKECMKKDARDGSSVADLRPTGRVASCRWLVGITLSKNKGHTLFLES